MITPLTPPSQVIMCNKTKISLITSFPSFTVSGYSEDSPMVCLAPWLIFLTQLLQSTSGWTAGRCSMLHETNYLYHKDATNDPIVYTFGI